MNYYSGVYIPDTTSGLLGGHCVKIVGWGEDAGVVRQPRAETRVHDMMAAHVALLIFFFWLACDACARNSGVPYWTVANSWGTLWGGRAARSA